MKLIFKIARTELRNLFYSPIAWFLTIAFLVQCALTYIDMLHMEAMRQEVGGIGLQYMKKLTFEIFTNAGGVFSGVMQNLYLYIPLLTMGLISREINGGTISLLYSSPVKVREIVFGKYLAMMVYSLVLVAVVTIFMVSGVFNIKSPDTGILWSAALGFYLLLCAYSAIGLFMSSLTSYQVVAAVSTFIVIGALSYIGRLWQGIDFVRDLTYFLSLNGRTGHMLEGLITTKDIIYFMVIVYMFLSFTICKLKDSRETKPTTIRIARYVGIIVLGLLIGYVSSRPLFIGYLDTTANKDNTLTPNTQKIIKEFGDSELEITAYSNFLDNYYSFGMPEQRNLYFLRWEQYVRFKPGINFRFVNYYDTAYANGYDMFKYYKDKSMKQIVEQRAKSEGISMSLFKTPEEIRKQIDLKPELNRFVMQLKYKGRITYLRVYNDMIAWPSETEVSAAFKRLLQAKMPKILFVTGTGERSVDKVGDREYKTLTNEKTFRHSLINQGFDVDTLSLDSRDIPDSITALVIADPQEPLSPVAISKVQQYINKGGNLLIAGESGRQQITNPLLKTLGVQMVDGLLEQKSEDYAPSLVLPHFGAAAPGLFKWTEQDTLPVSMNGAAALAFTDTAGFKVQPLLLTDAQQSWNSTDRNPDLDLSAQAGDNADAAATFGGGNTLVHAGGHHLAGASTLPGTHMPAEPQGAGPQKHVVIKLDSSSQKQLRAIMTGAGTNEEKRKKMMVFMDSVIKKEHPAIVANVPHNTPGTQKPASLAVMPKPAMKPVAQINNGFVPDAGIRKSYPTALALTRQINGKEQRIIVTGDADFMSNAELNRQNVRTSNFLFSTVIFSWLDNGEFPIDTSRPDSKDNRVTVSTDQVGVLKIIYVWVLPAVLLIFGSILLIRRKRK